MTEPTPDPAAPPLFDRLVLASIVPAILLPVVAAAATIGGALIRETFGGMSEGIGSLVLAVFMFVLLGSMVLNGWLLLRHPQTLATGALPRRISVPLAVLEGVLLVWVVLLALGFSSWDGVVFGALLAVLSIVVCVLAVGRYFAPGSVPRLEAVALPAWARTVSVVYLVLAVVAVVFGLASPVLGNGWNDAMGIIGGPATWILLVLGLPWSHPLYFASVLVLLGTAPELGIVPTLVVLLAVVVNAVLVAQVLLSPARRARIANWFFRLGKGAPAPADEAVPPAPAALAE